jgi:hypothetical protein
MTREGEPISQLTIRLAEEVIRLSREPGKPRDAAVEWAEHVMVIIEAEIEARDNPPAPEADAPAPPIIDRTEMRAKIEERQEEEICHLAEEIAKDEDIDWDRSRGLALKKANERYLEGERASEDQSDV